MKILLTHILCLFTVYCFAQCPEFYDYEGNLSSSPNWIVCDGNNYTLSLQSNSNIGNYSIDWGDGSPLTTGTTWNANSPITHTYVSAVQNFSITITLSDVPCVVSGNLIMEEPTNASIQIPFGGLTSTCAPGSLEFINSSTDVSENTTFVWSFFDGTNNETYDFNNAGQLITHLYQQGTVNCATQVTLTAENECNTLQGGPSLATFTPLRIWDIDDASISPSSSLLCYPDTTVSLQNSTNRNCHAQGNVSQRYEYWNLGDYWGLGYDSIISWRPWPPVINVDVGFPGVGTYEVMLIDSSFCGLDTATQIINIVDQPIAGIAANKDTICAGESVTFQNLCSGFVSNYIWDFDDGTFSNATTTIEKTFTNTTTEEQVFNTSLIVQSEHNCSDTINQNIHVYQSPNVSFEASPTQQILPNSTVDIQNNSSTGNWDYLWDFGDNTTSNQVNPPPHDFSVSGDFLIKLILTSNNQCTDSASQWISILPLAPQADFSGDGKGCAPLTIQFENKSKEATQYSWDFGDGSYSGAENPLKTYYEHGLYSVSLTAISSAGNHSILRQEIIEVFETPQSLFTVITETLDIPGIILETNNISKFATSYYWDFGDSNTTTEISPTHNYAENGYYTIMLIANNDMCTDTSYQSISVTNKGSGNIIIPYSFTPNTNTPNNGNHTQNDGINDIFFPVILGAKKYKLNIFNRWGEHLFSTKNQSIGWNGYYKDQLCQTGVYIYKIHVVFLNGEEQKIVGQLTLVR